MIYQFKLSITYATITYANWIHAHLYRASGGCRQHHLQTQATCLAKSSSFLDMLDIKQFTDRGRGLVTMRLVKGGEVRLQAAVPLQPTPKRRRLHDRLLLCTCNALRQGRHRPLNSTSATAIAHSKGRALWL